jgi:hypothetical protein
MPSKQASVQSFVSQQKSAAQTAQDEQRLAESLSLWRSLLPLDGEDTEVTAAIDSLEQQIDNQSRQLLLRAESAYARGRRREGDTLMLKVLVLQPGEQQALAALRKSVSARAQAQQATKSTQENQAQMARQKSAPESVETQLRRVYASGDYAAVLAMSAKLKGEPNVETAKLLRFAHVAMADRAAQRDERDSELDHLMAAMAMSPSSGDPLLNRIVVLRKELSKEWYRRGNGLMKDDLPGAIAALEKSVSYNPDNHAARLKLKQARVLQKNLLKIKSGSTSVL